MYVRGPRHSITGGLSPPPHYIQVGGGEIAPHFARIDAYASTDLIIVLIPQNSIYTTLQVPIFIRSSLKNG